MPEVDEARAARAERILDVAAGLLAKWGYRRLTVEDIAEHAGIGKGTIYLHWKTREALFVAVLLRELLGSAEELIEGLRTDPRSVLLHRLTRAQYLNVQRRPLLRAVYTDDSQVLGKLRTGLQETLDRRHHTAFEGYLLLLSEHGLLRAGVTVSRASYVFHAIMHGFLLADTDSETPLDEAGLLVSADLLASVMSRSLESEESFSTSMLRPVAERAAQLFGESAAADRAVLRRAY
jgi:AcrR family transcriptional regulator